MSEARKRKRQSNNGLPREDSLGEEVFEGMVGSGAAMQQIFKRIRKLASTDAPVLILGESGTGKEKAALAIHRRSPRRESSFTVINCGALPENLIEAELFGHEKGAFTGAHTQRVGQIEGADGGTLFLDEIGELPLHLQVKLLRFLQEKSVQRIGGRKVIHVDTRVIAATNRNLWGAVREGTFREDLYYRLAVVELNLPPLRDRREDIPLLAASFLEQCRAEYGRRPMEFSHEALDSLQMHDWPGNVRELENRVKRAVVLAESLRVRARELELSPEESTRSHRTLEQERDELERRRIEHALRKYSGNVSRVARDLGLSRPAVYERMKKLGVKRQRQNGTAGTEGD